MTLDHETLQRPSISNRKTRTQSHELAFKEKLKPLLLDVRTCFNILCAGYSVIFALLTRTSDFNSSQSEGANELLVPSGDALVTTSDAPVTSSFLFLVAMHLLLLAMHLLLVASCFVLGFCNTIQCVFIVFVGRSNIVCPLRWNCANLVLDFDPTRNEMIVFHAVQRRRFHDVTTPVADARHGLEVPFGTHEKTWIVWSGSEHRSIQGGHFAILSSFLILYIWHLDTFGFFLSEGTIRGHVQTDRLS